MSEQLETILNIFNANYRGCHNCKYHNREVIWNKRKECLKCVPINWILTENMILGADWKGCHNCKFFSPECNWQNRGNECKVCIPNNWGADATAEVD